MPDLETTVHHVREYEGGPLAIHGHIYGEPHIRYLLMEDPDSFGITPSQIAWSYSREGIEALLLQLRPAHITPAQAGEQQ